MTSEYKNFDPKWCKAKVGDGTGWQWFQCQRRPWRDGWCKQHHPDSVAERQRERSQRYEEKYQRSPEVQLDWACKEIARLKAENARLRARIAEIGEASDADT